MSSPRSPDTSEIDAALARVLASSGFRGAPQLAAFLRYIVTETLAGRSERLRASTIGVEALGRAETFDPQRDPIVRVEANRLRQALDAYYAGTGADDDIVIEVPRGRYVPNFRPAAEDLDTACIQTSLARPWARRRSLLLAAIASAVFAVAAVLWMGSQAPSPIAAGQLRAPVLVIDLLQSTSSAAEPIATAMSHELATVIGYIQVLSVVPGPVPEKAPPPGEGIDGFRLGGQVDAAPDGSATVTLRLDYGGAIAWTRDWHLAAGERDLAAIARDVAKDVGRMFGIMHARVRADMERLGPGYRCLIAAADSLRKFDFTQHVRVRNCLERTTAENPDFALAFGLLAFVYEREYLHDLPSSSLEHPPLERSFAAAKRMLALWPESAVSQLALMENLYLRDDLAGAFAAGERALELNPIDTTVSGMVGLRLYLGGAGERGAALLTKSASRFGNNLSSIDFGLFCLAYMAGDLLEAARHVQRDDDGAFPYGLASQALLTAATGDHERARRILDGLTVLYPGWSDPHAMLARFIKAPAILERLSADLLAIRGP
jgi:adenylate cyclase